MIRTGSDFQWNDYLALDPASVKRRFEQRFAVPEQTRIAINNGAVEIAGSVPYEWLERVRREATLIPGVNSVVETGREYHLRSGAGPKTFRSNSLVCWTP